MVILRSLKLRLLQVPSGVSIPNSVALPFGTFERTLKDPCNSDAALGISACMEDLEVGSSHSFPHDRTEAPILPRWMQRRSF